MLRKQILLNDTTNLQNGKIGLESNKLVLKVNNRLYHYDSVDGNDLSIKLVNFLAQQIINNNGKTIDEFSDNITVVDPSKTERGAL